MDYQMMPFSHIDRSTALHAVLKSTTITAITPKSATEGYKNKASDTKHPYELRYAVDTEKTLAGFTNRFNQGDVFRSATEIRDIFLAPKRLSGASYNSDALNPDSMGCGSLTQWWNGNLGSNDAFEITGDNTRESPYNHLYPRLTTKSNTCTIHDRVQPLKKARGTDPARWVEGRDRVLSEHRGSAALERYMNPNDKELAALAQPGASFDKRWDSHYRFRVIHRKQFAP